MALDPFLGSEPALHPSRASIHLSLSPVFRSRFNWTVGRTTSVSLTSSWLFTGERTSLIYDFTWFRGSGSLTSLENSTFTLWCGVCWLRSRPHSVSLLCLTLPLCCSSGASCCVLMTHKIYFIDIVHLMSGKFLPVISQLFCSCMKAFLPDIASSCSLLTNPSPNASQSSGLSYLRA